MRLDRITEGSFYDVSASFRDAAWVATVPVAARYRIDCETTGHTIRDWTDITPAQSVTITVTATENTLRSQSNKSERRVITVQADPGTDRQYVAAYKWLVVNAKGVE